MKDFLTSSSDPHKLSRTFKGIATLLIPIIIAVTGLAEADINTLVDALVNLIVVIGTLLGALQVVYGLARKIYLQRWSAEV